MTILLLGNRNAVYSYTGSGYDLSQIPWVFAVKSDLSSLSGISVAAESTSVLAAIDVSVDMPVDYSVRQFIASDTVARTAVLVDNTATSVVAAVDVEADLGGSYSIGMLVKDTNCKYSVRGLVERPLTVRYDLSRAFAYATLAVNYGVHVVSNTTSPYRILQAINKYTISRYSLVENVQAATSCKYDLAVTTPVRRDLTAVYTIYEPLSEDIVTASVFAVGGVPVDFDDVSMSIDESSFCWAVTCTVSDVESWSNCQVGELITITIGTDNYVFEIDSRDRVTKFGENQYTVHGRSATLKYGEGAEPIYNTWGATSAHAVIDELVDTPVSITTLDWNIPADVLASDGETPMGVITRLAQAAGGIVYTTCDGILKVVPKHKVAPADYVISATDYSISDLDDIYSITESRTKKPGYNQVEVTNEPESSSDSITIEVSDIDKASLTATAKVTIFPFVPTLELQSSHLGVTIPSSTTEIVEEHIDQIEIINGAGSVQKPVFQLLSYEYIDADMGTLTANGVTITTAQKGTTLAKVTYSTKYHEFIVTATEAESTQIYTED
jgi:hypothetical protein